MKIVKVPKKGGYELSEARRVVKARIAGAQPHDPNMVQLPGGGWVTLVKTQARASRGYILYNLFALSAKKF